MTKPRVCVVSYLNTVPLIWGMLHGAVRDRFHLAFRLPAECADMLAEGSADIGIVPAYELTRQPLEVIPGLGIACHGAVRSILLVSKKEPGEIRTLATDTSSRTSVQLARVVLARRYGSQPALLPHAPELDRMLEAADAAVVIGDPALRVDPAELPYRVYDLGQEWLEMTGLPMVFAVWAGRPGIVTPEIARGFEESFRCGQAEMDRIVASEAAGRGLAGDLVRRYLTAHIRYELGDAERQGMMQFLQLARSNAAAPQTASDFPQRF